VDERRLARPVGTEHGDELAGGHRQVEVLPDQPSAETHGRAARLDGIGLESGSHLPNAVAKPCNCWTCQFWNVAEAGVRVSVMGTTGMPALLASRPEPSRRVSSSGC